MIDARGLSCPIPVVMVQKEVKKNAPDELTVLVDNRAAVENISRYAALQHYSFGVTRDGGDYRLELKRSEEK